MKQGYNDNWLAFQEMCYRKSVVAYWLRFAVFSGSVMLVALLVWWGVSLAAPAFCAYQARVQAEMEAEDAGLRAAYEEEMIEGALRGGRLRDNGQAVDASAWQHSSEAPECWKGDGR